jgi:hypothetical protein
VVAAGAAETTEHVALLVLVAVLAGVGQCLRKPVVQVHQGKAMRVVQLPLALVLAVGAQELLVMQV